MPQTGFICRLRSRLLVRAFTLVEIMIAVVIIGMLAAMAVGAMARFRARTEATRVANNLRIFEQAFQTYIMEFGIWPVTGEAGVVPPEMVGRINPETWAAPTPGDGRWGWENRNLGVTAGISMFGSRLTDPELAVIDRLIDDGDVTTGVFRRAADGRPLYVIEE